MTGALQVTLQQGQKRKWRLRITTTTTTSCKRVFFPLNFNLRAGFVYVQLCNTLSCVLSSMSGLSLQTNNPIFHSSIYNQVSHFRLSFRVKLNQEFKNEGSFFCNCHEDSMFINTELHQAPSLLFMCLYDTGTGCMALLWKTLSHASIYGDWRLKEWENLQIYNHHKSFFIR